jgi:DNA-binding NarL/FixJ family response regulator
LIKALYVELGEARLAELEAQTVLHRPVPQRLMVRLLKEEIVGTNLTPRQREVMVLLTSGFSRQEIADEMGITLETVKSHLKHAYSKLGVRGQIDAINTFLEG